MFEPHQQRVVDEHAELYDRLGKLTVFIESSPIFAGLDPDEQGRLFIQRAAMSAYEAVLAERIRHF